MTTTSRPALPLSLCLCIATALASGTTRAQQIHVEPYLQLARPDSIQIMWETTSGDESTVQWGLTPALGSSAQGVTANGPAGTRRHSVALVGLAPDTRYYYRSVTGAAVSGIYDFVTPALPGAEASFNLIAMSDMQRDSLNPNKFEEIILDGVLPFSSAQLGADLPSALSMVLLPGDLVDDGWVYSQFADDFFLPAAPLLSHVPLYPVPGNHEGDSPYFFDYFHLPDNGSPGYEEHWWYHDTSNLRVIGLDSNPGYRIEEQLDWLQTVLDDACTLDHIDFVFAELHHPHLSELWIDGEIDYTGDVIAQLERFSSQCGKPSIHFFGHTHGYSRGQSRDHQHLWVNVATAGGNIDYWDEYAQNDYEEFTVTQDEWGFVVVELDAGDDPQFRLRRVSRGNELQARDNEIRDDISIRRYNQPPDTPEALSPNPSEVVAPGSVTLVADTFSDPDGDLHGASHWQLAASCDSFDDPLTELWQQHENLYQSVDQNEGIDLTQLQLSLPAAEGYCWRVRYRDRSLRYSDWSQPLSFVVESYTTTGNLLLNPGAEEGTTHWQTQSGVLESLAGGECAGIEPHAGARYFVAGGLCESSAFAEAVQLVDVAAHAEAIDTGQSIVQFGGVLSNFNGSDQPEIRIILLSESGELLAASQRLASIEPAWTELSGDMAIPAGTRSIAFFMSGTRNDGEDNDSYLDALQLALWLPGPDGAGGSGPAPMPPVIDDDEGCSCTVAGRTTPRQHAPALAMLLASLGVALRRRRGTAPRA